jgi:hypothetical protein
MDEDSLQEKAQVHGFEPTDDNISEFYGFHETRLKDAQKSRIYHL